MHGSVEPALPIERDIGPAYVSSLVISLAIAVVSVTGLVWGPGGRYGVGSPIVQVSQGGDAANLILGLPALLGAMWLARRGSLIGLLLWPGALFYVLYAYAPYLVAAPFDALFFGYIALVTLSAWTLTYIVASIDGEEVRRRLAVAPARSVGGALIDHRHPGLCRTDRSRRECPRQRSERGRDAPAMGRRLCAWHTGPAPWRRAPLAPCNPRLRGRHGTAPGLCAEWTGLCGLRGARRPSGRPIDRASRRSGPPRHQRGQLRAPRVPRPGCGRAAACRATLDELAAGGGREMNPAVVLITTNRRDARGRLRTDPHEASIVPGTGTAHRWRALGHLENPGPNRGDVVVLRCPEGSR